MKKQQWQNGIALGLVLTLGTSVLGAGFSTNLFENGVLWNYGYEGGTYPTNGFTPGERWLEDPQAGPPPDGSVTLTTEGIVIDTGASGNGMGFRLLGGGTFLPYTNVWTVEFRMRLTTTNNTYHGGLEFRQNIFGAGFLVRAHPTVVELRASGGAPASAQAIGTNWHTYRITLVGTTSTLYMDTNHSPILTTSGNSGAGNQIEFGDFGSLIASGAAEYDYVRWAYGQAVGDAPIPEPSVLALLGLAGCAILWCNRRR